ncbi:MULTISPECIES: hypothetical protein [unclassified Rathayibacter]|uniref:hypothetical protein n=1 Tax=unclassified Rathayibacter TaxID=2609250 RepID=UPI0015E3C390|nr:MULTISPECIES: hypothetical protein [unclassified Rathayibacter]
MHHRVRTGTVPSIGPVLTKVAQSHTLTEEKDDGAAGSAAAVGGHDLLLINGNALPLS